MAARRIFYITQDALIVWIRERARLREAQSFQSSDKGFSQFSAYLGRESQLPSLMVVVGHFETGRGEYRAGNWEKATRSFEKCLELHPEDDLSKLYVQRCEQLLAEPPADWDGVWVMKEK